MWDGVHTVVLHQRGSYMAMGEMESENWVKLGISHVQ